MKKIGFFVLLMAVLATAQLQEVKLYLSGGGTGGTNADSILHFYVDSGAGLTVGDIIEWQGSYWQIVANSGGTGTAEWLAIIDATGTDTILGAGDSTWVTSDGIVNLVISGKTATITIDTCSNDSLGVVQPSGDDFTVTNGILTIKNNGVDAAEIRDTTINTADIKNDAVDSAKVKDKTLHPFHLDEVDFGDFTVYSDSYATLDTAVVYFTNIDFTNLTLDKHPDVLTATPTAGAVLVGNDATFASMVVSGDGSLGADGVLNITFSDSATGAARATEVDTTNATLTTYVANHGGTGSTDAESLQGVLVTPEVVSDGEGLVYESDSSRYIHATFKSLPVTAPTDNYILKIDTDPDPDTFYWAADGGGGAWNWADSAGEPPFWVDSAIYADTASALVDFDFGAFIIAGNVATLDTAIVDSVNINANAIYGSHIASGTVDNSDIEDSTILLGDLHPDVHSWVNGQSDADSIKSIPVQDTTGAIADNYILKYNAGANRLDWEADGGAAGTGSGDTVIVITDNGGNRSSLNNTIYFRGGEGIDLDTINNVGDSIRIDMEIASTSNVGGASFSSSNFSVSAGGEVTIATGGVSSTGIANQTITKSDIDTTSSNFVFNDAYRVTSAVAESMLSTIGSVIALIEDSLNEYTELTDTIGVADTSLQSTIPHAAAADSSGKAVADKNGNDFTTTYQPQSGILTDIADGTIATTNLVNTTYPWADNEVADDITVNRYYDTTATRSLIEDSLDEYFDSSTAHTRFLEDSTASIDSINLNSTEITQYIQNRIDDDTVCIVRGNIVDPDTLEMLWGRFYFIGDVEDAWTVTKIKVRTMEAESFTIEFEEWTSADSSSGTETLIEAVALSSGFAADSTNIADASIAAGSMIVIDLGTGMSDNDKLQIYYSIWGVKQ